MMKMMINQGMTWGVEKIDARGGKIAGTMTPTW
jgi:hypothetical protein